MDLKPFYVIECVTHGHKKWDVKEKKEVPSRLFLYNGEGFPMSPDIIWLTSITRPDSGTWFTTSIPKAMRFETEAEADERVTSLIMQDGYLPGDVVALKIEPPKEDEG